MYVLNILIIIKKHDCLRAAGHDTVCVIASVSRSRVIWGKHLNSAGSADTCVTFACGSQISGCLWLHVNR